MRYRLCMASIQIRNVPPKLHEELKRRAVQRGMSLQEYLLAELEELASVPTIEEVIARARSRALFTFEQSNADIIREMRDAS